MSRVLLTPRWLAVHALAVALIVAMVFLGIWQYDRYDAGQQRKHLLARAPVPLSQLLTPGENVPAAAADRRVTLTGAYVPERQVYVAGHVHDQTMGLWDVVPLRTQDGSELLVLRGWVDEPGSPASAVPSGQVSLTAVLRPWQGAGDAQLGTDARLPGGQLTYLGKGPVADARALTDPAYQGFVLLTEQSAGAGSMSPTRLSLDDVAPQHGVGIWQHLSYWAQWWVFALAVVFFWVSFARSAVRRSREPEQPAPVVQPQGDSSGRPSPQDATT